MGRGTLAHCNDDDGENDDCESAVEWGEGQQRKSTYSINPKYYL